MSHDQTILLILLAYFAIGGMVVSFIDTAFEPEWRGGITGRVLAVATWPMAVFITIGLVVGVWVRNRTAEPNDNDPPDGWGTGY